MKYDVGIVGWWYYYNYGSILTYLSLCKALESKGYSVLMIEKGYEDQSKNGLRGLLPEKAIKRYCNTSEYYNFDEMYRLNDICTTFVSGSDQMWNPSCEKDAGPEYFLDFVDDNHRKISYASSLGNSTDASESFKEKYSKLAKRFTAISVREESGIESLKKIFGVNATKVCDPVFLCPRTVFYQIANRSKLINNKEYLLCFILDPTEEKKEYIRRAADRLNLEVICLVDLTNAHAKAEKMSEFDVRAYSDIEDFLFLYSKASYIITDSFHGTCFSILFNKPFSSIPNKARGEKRVKELLAGFDLEDRIVNDLKEEICVKDINYENVERLIDNQKQEGFSYLISNIGKRENPRYCYTVSDKVDKKNCTGCGACSSVCPVNAIEMCEDQEGFLKPIINKNLCISCGKCEKTCPVINPIYENNREPLSVALVAENSIRRTSSSGGAFYVLAKKIIEDGGVVCGAAFTSDFKVEHRCVENMFEITALQGSKYYQSNTKDSFRKIKTELDKGRKVMFTGMPCQVAGLNSFLNKQYKNLITVDIFCHGISSKKVFDKYKRDVFGKEKRLNNLQFKAKEPWGWHAGVNAYFDDNSHYAEPLERDPFYIAYLSSNSQSKSCGKCQFNRLPRQGDLSIGDFWGIDRYKKELNDGLGTSAVLINTSKGMEYLEKLSDGIKAMEEVPLSITSAGNSVIKAPLKENRNRDFFFSHLDDTDFRSLAYGAKNNSIYLAYYKGFNRIVPIAEQGLFQLAKTVVKMAGSRKIVTWVRSNEFEEVLRKYFGKNVAFGVTLRKEKADGNYIKEFSVLKGKCKEYFVVSLDRNYDEESYKLFQEYEYQENKDYIYRVPKTVVLKDFDLSKGPYIDHNGNTIEGYSGIIKQIVFKGRNNHITFGKKLNNPQNISIIMNSNNMITIGDNFNTLRDIRFEFMGNMFMPASVNLGDNISFTGGLLRLYSDRENTSISIDNNTTFEVGCELHANAGKKIVIGKDCMFSHNIDIWAGDGHSIFDVKTGNNTNSVYDYDNLEKNQIIIGNHVWVAKGAFILHGTNIGNGGIVGARSVVKGKYPNNCVIVGNPSKIVKTDVAWSRAITEDITACGWENVQGTFFEENINKRKVLILGGSGRMSKYLTEICLENGDDVTIATRGKRGFEKNFYPVKKLIFDRFDIEQTKSKLNGNTYDVVFDCTGYAPQCIDAVLSVITCRRYIFVSSFGVYAHYKNGLRMKESDLPVIGVPYKTYVDFNGTNWEKYASAKYNAECLLANKYADVNYAIVRIPFVMSKEEDYDDQAASRLKKYVDAVVSGKEINSLCVNNMYNFVEAKDEADFLYYLAGIEYTGVVNFASDGELSIRTIVEYAEKVVGKKINYSKDAPMFPFSGHKEVTMNLDVCKELGYYPLKLSDWLLSAENEECKIDQYIVRSQLELK